MNKRDTTIVVVHTKNGWKALGESEARKTHNLPKPLATIRTYGLKYEYLRFN